MRQAKKLDNKMLATAILSGIAGIAASALIAKAVTPAAPATHRFWNSHEEESDSTNYLLVGGICSLIAAGAALLLAPKSGRELRQDITDKYEDLHDTAHEITDNVHEYANNFAKKAKKMAHKMHDEVEDVGEDYYESFKDKLHQFADIAEMGFKVWNSLSKRR